MDENSIKTCKILSWNDLQDSKATECLKIIREKNESLAVLLEQNLKMEDAAGIRADVLSYLCNSVDDISEDQIFVFNIVMLTRNEALTPAWYEWFIQYFKSEHAISMDEFMALLSEALEKKIPLEKLKEIFSDCKNNLLDIYESINSYKDDEISPVVKNVQSEISVTPDEKSQHMKGEKTEVIEPFHENESDFAKVLSGLIAVVSNDDEEKKDVYLSGRERLMQIASGLYSFGNDITACTGEILRDWQRERDESARLKTLCKLQQKFLSSQQQKIDEMRNEIIRLKGKLQDAEKTEMHHAAINEKINELQMLSGKGQEALLSNSYSGIY